MFDGSNSNTVPLTGRQKTLLIIECIPVVFFVVMILRIRDLLSGVAPVEEDVLERSWRSGRRGNSGNRRYYGKFEGLGKIRLMPKAHFQSQNGQRYHVVYSPISRIVWTLEPLC